MEEVLCLLRWDTQRERVVCACHRAYKGLHLDQLTCLHVDIAECVPRKVDEEFLARVVWQRGSRSLLRPEVLSQMEVELGLLVAVRMQTLVVLPHELTRYMLVRQLLDKVGEQFQERLHSLVGVCRISGMKAFLQDRVVQPQQPLYAERIALRSVHILICLVPAHLQIFRNLPVRDAGFLQMKKLLDLAHVNDCSCHITLPFLIAAKLGDLTR